MERPILFNTEMVRAILDGRKTQTRRIAKPLNLITGNRTDGLPPEQFSFFVSRQSGFVYWNDCDRRLTINERDVRAPFRYGDVLWVRETWAQYAVNGRIIYRADADGRDFAAHYNEFGNREACWRPSIHMPWAAARIFLRVMDVRVERLQDMSEEDAIAEGFSDSPAGTDSPLERFSVLWDKTIKRDNLREYGWHANPWVWVVEFERMERPASWEV